MEKLLIAQLVKKVLSFHEIRRFFLLPCPHVLAICVHPKLVKSGPRLILVRSVQILSSYLLPGAETGTTS